MMDRVRMPLTVVGSENMTRINELFKLRTQYKELVEDTEDQLAKAIGKQQGFDEVLEIINGIEKQDKIDRIAAEREAEIERLAKEEEERSAGK